MFACGMCMVLMQLLAIGSICAGMMFPTCVDSNQCPRGQFCYAKSGQESGRCAFCGENAPLVPYFETTNEETGYGPTNYEVIWNRCRYDSYPKDRLFGIYRSDSPKRFAGFNDSHVEAVCARPFKAIPKYEVVQEGPEDKRVVKSFSGGDVPPGIMPADEWDEFRFGDEYSAESVASWCDTCVHALTRDVSNWNEHGLFRTSLRAMSLLDVSQQRHRSSDCVSVRHLLLQLFSSDHGVTFSQWSTVWMCSYVVGLSIVGELKDATLCTIAADRGRDKLTRGWIWALWLLGTLRVHAFLSAVLSAIPMVILCRGGEAMTVAFNTVAILFLTEVEYVGFRPQLSLLEYDCFCFCH